jgi:hypothetical protein
VYSRKPLFCQDTPSSFLLHPYFFGSSNASKSAGRVSRRGAGRGMFSPILEQNHRSTDLKSAGAQEQERALLEQNHGATDVKSVGAGIPLSAGNRDTHPGMDEPGESGRSGNAGSGQDYRNGSGGQSQARRQ